MFLPHAVCSVGRRRRRLLLLFVEVRCEVLKGKQMVQLMQVTGVGLSELLLHFACSGESLYCSSSIFKCKQAEHGEMMEYF